MSFKNICFVMLVSSASALIAYDCRHEQIQTSVIDGVSIRECLNQTVEPKVTKTRIQLLQRDPLLQVRMFQCNIHVLLTIFKCGVFDHMVNTRDSVITFVHELTGPECYEMHRSRILRYRGREMLTDLKPNSTFTHRTKLAGAIYEGDECKGETFTFGDMIYEKAVVQAQFTVQISDGLASVDLSRDIIHLSTLSAQCKYTDGSCIHHNAGFVMWDKNLDGLTCENKKYEVLFEGNAHKMSRKGSPDVISLQSEENAFSLLVPHKTRICSQMAWATEHPQLFILELEPSEVSLFSYRSSSPLNKNLVTYINTKVVYVERHLAESITALYSDLLTQKCETERMVLSNLLSLAYISSDEFAYSYKKAPGYTAMVRGEAIHLVKCTPVEVAIDNTGNECYAEAKVTYRNSTHFISPRSHILKKVGTPIPCNYMVPVLYKLTEDNWFSLYPKVSIAKAPEVLDPNPNKTWEYVSLHGLAVVGIYSLQEIEALQHQMMFSGEQKALDESIVRKIGGENINLPVGDALNLFTPEQIKTYFRRAWDKVSSILMTVGDITSSCIGFFVLGKVLMTIVDWIANYFLLKSIFGTCSRYLWLSCCTGLTHFFVHQRYTSYDQQGNEASPELAEIAAKAPYRDLPLLPRDINEPKNASEVNENRCRIYPDVSQPVEYNIYSRA